MKLEFIGEQTEGKAEPEANKFSRRQGAPTKTVLVYGEEVQRSKKNAIRIDFVKDKIYRRKKQISLLITHNQ